MIARNEEITDEYIQRKIGKKPVNYDSYISMRIDSKTLNEFKELVGEPYQPKIRDLIVQYINRCKYTYTKEEERRNKMLGKK